MDLGWAVLQSQVPSSCRAAKWHKTVQFRSQSYKTVVSDVEGRSGPHASARSATDEWLKGLGGRWQCRLYHTKQAQTNGRVVLLPPPALTSGSSFSHFLALFTCIYPPRTLLRHLTNSLTRENQYHSHICLRSYRQDMLRLTYFILA